jgi:hypothetical protein
MEPKGDISQAGVLIFGRSGRHKAPNPVAGRRIVVLVLWSVGQGGRPSFPTYALQSAHLAPDSSRTLWSCIEFRKNLKITPMPVCLQQGQTYRSQLGLLS